MISYLIETSAVSRPSYSYTSSQSNKYSNVKSPPNAVSETYEGAYQQLYTYVSNADGGESYIRSYSQSDRLNITEMRTASYTWRWETDHTSVKNVKVDTHTHSSTRSGSHIGVMSATINANGYATQADEQNSGTTGASGWTKGYMDGTKRITYTGSFGSIVTYVSKQSTQEVGFNTTSSTKLYHIVGTTTAFGSHTAPTTTGTSWTEVVISYKTKTTSCKIYESTSTIVNPNRKVSNHTVFELSAGEFLFTLKGNAGDTAVVGDGKNPIWESYAGPKTVTISELPHVKSQKELVDESVPNNPWGATQSTTTYTGNPYIKAGTTTLYYTGATDTSFQTLTSSSLKANTTEFTQETYERVYAEFETENNFPTASSKVQDNQRETIKLSNATFNENNYGTTSTTYSLPYLRSANSASVSEENTVENATTNVEGGSAWGHEGNYFLYLGFSASRNNGGADHWALAYNNCWGVVGDGTSATAVPKISWEANGTSIKSWDVALISKGVQTPYPAYGTEEIGTLTLTGNYTGTSWVTTNTQSWHSTSFTQSSTADTKTTGIWGNEYREVTSSSDSSSMTISTKTFSLKAGGAPYSCIVGFETWAYTDLPSYLQTPNNVFVVGGAANIEDESVSALVHAGEYYDITLSSASTFKDKTMKRTTHEIKYVGEVVYGGNWYFMSAL